MARALVLKLMVAMTLGLGGVVRAEVIGPLIPGGAFETGVQYRQTISAYGTAKLDIRDTSVWLRYGLSGTTTFSGELMAGHNVMRTSSGRSPYDHQYYLAGAGLQTRVGKYRDVIFHAGAHYTEAYIFPNEAGTHHRTHYRLDLTLLGQYSFELWSQALSVIGGPGYFYLEDVYWGELEYKGVTYNAKNNWGGIIGGNAVLGDIIVVHLSLVITDYAQARTGLGFRF